MVEASTSLSEYGIDLIPYGVAGPVAEVATELDVTVYDASYLALAETSDATVYTADSRLLDATEGSPYADVAAPIRYYES